MIGDISNAESLIAPVINSFQSVSLDEMDGVKLMNRTDTKFVIQVEKLKQILGAISDKYKVLEIDNLRMLPYRTTYYDTDNFDMYLAHHNCRLNRYKIREREYVSSSTAFLEVKFKNNKRQTRKKRVMRDDYNSPFTTENQKFVAKVSPFSLSDLEPKIENHFTRMTLVHHSYTERVTIDINLSYNFGDKNSLLDKLSIIEIKRDKHSVASDLGRILRENHIMPSGMSKYCLGTALLNHDIKQNNFKPKIRRLSKLSGYDLKTQNQ